jgi:hypothetical protein
MEKQPRMMFPLVQKRKRGGCVMLTQLTRGKLQFMDAPEQSLAARDARENPDRSIYRRLMLHSLNLRSNGIQHETGH